MPTTPLDRRQFLQKLAPPHGLSRQDAIPVDIGTQSLAEASPLGSRGEVFPLDVFELPAEGPTPAPLVIGGTLTPYSGPWGKAQAAHLLRRTGFGVKKSDLDLVLGLGSADMAVAHILDVDTVPPAPPVNNYNNANFTDPVVPSGQVWLNAAFNLDAEPYRVESFRGWWYDLMLHENASIRERMTLFWHNHFATQTNKVLWGRSVYEHNQKLRAAALGNFKTLTKTVTIDGTMLLYLNGFLNTKGKPDENYARELQELFTIGKDTPQGYTEDDVVQAARVLTGWRINFADNTTYHYPLDHDFGDKQFSAFYNNTKIAGTVQGEVELDALLDMIFARPEVALYLCRKIYRWFVYYNIDATVEANIIQPLAQILRSNNYEIRPVIETLLGSQHFFEAAQTGCFIKTPLDAVLGTLREFNTTIPVGTVPFNHLNLQYQLSLFMGSMGMIPGDPPNVAGWQAFRQTPQFYRIWANGDTLRNRNALTDVLTFYFLDADGDHLAIDPLAFAAQFATPGDPVALVKQITELLLPQPLSATKLFLLKSVLLSGLPTDAYWTTAWAVYTSNPTDPMAVQTVLSRLKNLLYYVMRLPEFQLA